MAERIQWVNAGNRGERLTFEAPGAVTDAHGTTNTAPALATTGFCVEGTVDELRRWLTDALAALPGGDVLYSITRADVEDLAGRSVTDTEAERIARAIEHSTVGECVAAAVEQVVGVDELDEEDLDFG